MGWVRNVVLINVYLDLENPGGVRISGGRVYEPELVFINILWRAEILGFDFKTG